MRYLAAILLFSSLAIASDRKWEEATVVKMTEDASGVQVVAGTLYNHTYAMAQPIRKSFYWLRTEKYTYVVPNYCKGSFIQPWLRVTIGGTAKISAESSRTMRIIDDDGKERKLSILQRIANTAEAPK